MPLWRRIGPLRYGDIKLRMHTECWDERREAWLRAEEIDLRTDGQPVVLFHVTGTQPAEYVQLRGDQIAEWVTDGRLLSKGEVDRRAQQLLDACRQDSTDE